MVDGDGRWRRSTIDGNNRWQWSTVDGDDRDSDDYSRWQWHWMLLTMVGDQQWVAMVTTGKGKGNATVMETGRTTTTPSSKNC